MNTILKTGKYLILFILIPFFSNQLMAQGGRMEEMLDEQRKEFFTERLQLTPEESKAFWPVYDDYTNRKDRLNDENRNLFRYTFRNLDNLSDKEVEDALEKHIEFQAKEHELFMEYHKQFLSILPERKVMMLYIAEAQFKQHLLRQIRQGRHGRGPGGRGMNGR